MFRHIIWVIVTLTLAAVAGCPSAMDGAAPPNSNGATNGNVNMNTGNMNAGGGQPTMFTAELTADQATPETTSTASGSGTATFDPAQSTLTFDFSFRADELGVTAAEFHTGPPGVAGPLLIDVSAFRMQSDTGGPLMVVGAVMITEEQATALLDGNVYLVLVTAAYPNGIIRGQLIRQ